MASAPKSATASCPGGHGRGRWCCGAVRSSCRQGYCGGWRRGRGISIPRGCITFPTASIPGEGLVVGTVAALRPEKNIGRLIRAFATVAAGTTTRLCIVGGGAEHTGLEALAAELGVAGQVGFTGPVAQPAALYGQFDVFALSSDTEQMPLSVLEAMGTGLPVLATDVGDVRTMLAQANHPFMTAVDDAAYADGLRRILADPDGRQRIGMENRAKAERDYDQETMFQAYGRLFSGPNEELAR